MQYQAESLQKAVSDREQAAIRLSHLKQDLDSRELFLTPIGDAYKALGPNDTDRKNACKRLIDSDELCKKQIAEIRALELSLADLNAVIAAVEVARRAEEWDITRELAQSLKVFAGHNPGTQAAQVSVVDAARTLGAQAVEDQAYLEFSSPPVQSNPTSTMLDHITDNNDYRGLGESVPAAQWWNDNDIPF
jgi:hypothetical protein